MSASLDRYCTQLPTDPIPGLRVLVTGASGYIGGALIPELLARGYQVTAMVRKKGADLKKKWPQVDVVLADALVYSDLKKALIGIDCAYYFMHALQLKKKQFIKVDNQAAINFRKAAAETNLKRIIYLGSLGDPSAPLSDHLQSRIKVAEELRKGVTPVTFLGAAVIIGSGSASYMIIKHLVKNCPVFILPPWARSLCQPIAIRDVIKYLVGCLEHVETTGESYCIGGPKPLTYESMLRSQAKITGKRRLFISGFISSNFVYSAISNLLTPVRSEIIVSLMESCTHDVICKNSHIRDVMPFRTLTYEEALAEALRQ